MAAKKKSKKPGIVSIGPTFDHGKVLLYGRKPPRTGPRPLKRKRTK